MKHARDKSVEDLKTIYPHANEVAAKAGILIAMECIKRAENLQSICEETVFIGIVLGVMKAIVLDYALEEGTCVGCVEGAMEYGFAVKTELMAGETSEAPVRPVKECQ